MITRFLVERIKQDTGALTLLEQRAPQFDREERGQVIESRLDVVVNAATMGVPDPIAAEGAWDATGTAKGERVQSGLKQPIATKVTPISEEFAVNVLLHYRLIYATTELMALMRAAYSGSPSGGSSTAAAAPAASPAAIRVADAASSPTARAAAAAPRAARATARAAAAAPSLFRARTSAAQVAKGVDISWAHPRAADPLDSSAIFLFTQLPTWRSGCIRLMHT